jgi:hypothetical protein
VANLTALTAAVAQIRSSEGETMAKYSNEARDLDEATIKTYKDILHQLSKSKVPVLIGGGLALRNYMPYANDFGDLDIFCLEKDYPKIMKLLSKAGFEVWVKDERWLAKAFKKKAQVDVIFGSPNGVNKVNKSWFAHAHTAKALGEKIDLVGPEHLLWCKLYVQNIDYFAGVDINHLLLKMAGDLDWGLVLDLVGDHWELLFGYLLHFRFVYPAKRKLIPDWVMEELVQRLPAQSKAAGRRGICRGNLLSSTDYEVDFKEGGFKRA